MGIYPCHGSDDDASGRIRKGPVRVSGRFAIGWLRHLLCLFALGVYVEYTIATIDVYI